METQLTLTCLSLPTFSLVPYLSLLSFIYISYPSYLSLILHISLLSFIYLSFSLWYRVCVCVA
jgi:hypothetical protein